MRILWANPHFLHPTNKGGQIRTLEMLKHLHRWHEVHYVALENPAEPEGMARSGEYSAKAYPVAHDVPPRGSAQFLLQAARNLISPLPLAVDRYVSGSMRSRVASILSEQRFDAIVADFLFAAPNVPDLAQAVLFEHNVETCIWERHAENAGSALQRAFFRNQARRMFAYEREACRQAAYVVTVSEADTERIRSMFGVDRVSDVPTGVDVEYFAPPTESSGGGHLVFIGSMDWLPNIDGVVYFAEQILPLIHRTHPDCRVVVAGRNPPARVLELAEDKRIEITGTVPDIRPFVWGAAAAIVPLRIGGGTRLKIYEAMAAGVPVVSTTVGAEGLPVTSGDNCFLADSAEEFAGRCVELLDSAARREAMAAAALKMVSERFSWESAARRMEEILVASKRASG